jgi:hypothetical protein
MTSIAGWVTGTRSASSGSGAIARIATTAPPAGTSSDPSTVITPAIQFRIVASQWVKLR